MLGGAGAATRQRIAIFHPAIPTTLLTETGGGSAWRAFFAELRRLGYIEGENLIIERYSAEGHHERYADLAREIVTRNPDLIVTGTNPVVIVFKAATQTGRHPDLSATRWSRRRCPRSYAAAARPSA